MKAIILAGGVRSGQELSGAQLPRALWPLPTEAVIVGVIRFLLAQGVDKIAICANGKTPLIAAQLHAAGYDWLGKLHFSEDRFPRGPAGCLKDLEAWLGGDDFVVIQGTGLYNFDLRAMLHDHAEKQAAITVAANASTDRSGEKVLEPAGVFVMRAAVLQHLQTVGYQDIKEQLIPRVRAAAGKVICHEVSGSVQLIHGPEHYLQALPAAIDGASHAGMTELKPGVWAHPSAKVAPGVRCGGQVYIDKNAVVEEGAIIVGPAVIGPGVRVGRNVLVSRAVLMEGCMIAAHGEIADTVVAPRVRVVQTQAPQKGLSPSDSAFGTPGVFSKARKALEGFYPGRSRPHSVGA